MKKILLIEQNQDGTVGGSHYCLLYLIKCLDKKRYTPVVMFYEPNTIVDKFNRENCQSVIFRKPLGKIFKPPNPILKLLYMVIQKGYNFIRVSLAPFIKAIFFIIKNDIDVIHLNNSAHAGGEWLVAAKLLCKKCITHQRGFPQFGRLERKRAKYFDKIICVSKAIQNYLKSNGLIRNTITIYDGMDPKEYKKRIKKNKGEVTKEFSTNVGTFLIGVVGNFQEWKGQLTVIKAVEQLKENNLNLICLLIGDVSSRNKRDMEYFKTVQRQINDKGLRTNIIITGYRPDVPDMVNALDVMIHSSIEPEPFGMVLLEGMCLKKPIIATNIGGPKEIIENEVSGILVPPGDPNILAEKIEYLLHHPEVSDVMGENAFQRVADKFNLEQFSHRINSFYNELFLR